MRYTKVNALTNTMQHILAKVKPVLSKVLHSSTTWALAVYFLLATAITYPFILHPRTTLTAPLASDTSSSVVLYGAFVREKTNPFLVPRANTIAAPDGIKNNVGVNRVSFLSTAYLWISSVIFGPIMAHSLETFFGFLLTAAVMFLFIKAVTRSPGAAFVAGLAYGFWPHMLSLGRAAPTYTHMWLFILPLWAFWSLVTKGINRKRVVLASASILPAVFWTPYFTYHVSLVAAVCLLIAAWYIKDKIGMAKTAKLVGGIAASWLVLYLLYYFLGTSSASSEIPVRTLAEAYQQASHPLMYVLPGAFSAWGQGINHALVQLVPRAAQTNLYVGLSLLALAGTGVVMLMRQKVALGKKGKNEREALRVAMVMAAGVVVICFLFSMPPSMSLAGHSLPLPNQLVAEAVPALRAGQRLVMPLMGGLVVLAAIGVHLLAEKYPGRTKYAVLAIIIAVVGIDLWSPYPESATKLAPSPAMFQLKELPEGRVAQYQRGSLVGYPAQTMCVAQLYHKQPLINDCGLGRSPLAEATPSPQLAATISLPLCAQSQRLKRLHVDYVVIANSDRETLDCFQATPPIVKDDVYQIFKLR
jgi:hypothetical protein